jgi:hypothetical protein
MSQLNISTLANLAGSETTPIADVINGSARAWVNFNGRGTVAIRNSYNVSSITDDGFSHYHVNFTTAMPNSDYVVITSGAYSLNGNAYLTIGGLASTSPLRSTTTCAVHGSNGANASEDLDTCCVAIYSN